MTVCYTDRYKIPVSLSLDVYTKETVTDTFFVKVWWYKDWWGMSPLQQGREKQSVLRSQCH